MPKIFYKIQSGFSCSATRKTASHMSVAIWLEKSAGPRRVDKLGRDSKVILADQALQVVAFCKART